MEFKRGILLKLINNKYGLEMEYLKTHTRSDRKTRILNILINYNL